MKKKIVIVGLGGIGTWLSFTLANLKRCKQLEGVEVHGIDDDAVEDKNLFYQDFKEEDIYLNKSDVLEDRYLSDPQWFFGHNKRIISMGELKGYDLIVSAVDNFRFRHLLYQANDGPFHWIDLRSEGGSIAGFNKHHLNTIEVMERTIDGDSDEGKSCQLKYDLDAGRIQLGNRIIANIGAQWILNWTREGSLPQKFIHSF